MQVLLSFMPQILYFHVLWCLTVSLSLSHWYPWSGVVLDRIDSWSLHPFLLSIKILTQKIRHALNSNVLA